MNRKPHPISPEWAAKEAYEHTTEAMASLYIGALATFVAFHVESEPAIYALGMVGGAATVEAVHCGKKAIEYWHLTGALFKAERHKDSC